LAALVRSREAHGILQGSRLLQLDVGAQRLLETRCEHRDLLGLRDVVAARQEGEELFVVLVNGAHAAQLDEFAL
jgi:hypothetical protein